MPDPLSYSGFGRNRATAITFTFTWILLSGAWIWLDAANWIIIGLGLFTLPALYDLIANPRSSLSLSDTGLHWQSKAQSINLPLSQIRSMRFDTRLDMSVRVTALLTDGSKLRLPYHCLPPHKTLETALQNHGVKTERHHFTFI